MSIRARLTDGLAALAIETSEAQVNQLVDFVNLLHKWNQAFNLTAVRDPEEMVTRHLLDSLVVLPWLGRGATLDVGTGPGLPGIPLAILRPVQSFTLLDSNGKKIRFVRQAVTALGLANVEVVQARVEQYRNACPQVISRAFAALPEMLPLVGERVLPGGRLLAMKGAITDIEMAAISAPWSVRIEALVVPGLVGARQLVILERDDSDGR